MLFRRSRYSQNFMSFIVIDWNYLQLGYEVRDGGTKRYNDLAKRRDNLIVYPASRPNNMLGRQKPFQRQATSANGMTKIVSVIK